MAESRFEGSLRFMLARAHMHSLSGTFFWPTHAVKESKEGHGVTLQRRTVLSRNFSWMTELTNFT